MARHVLYFTGDSGQELYIIDVKEYVPNLPFDI